MKLWLLVMGGVALLNFLALNIWGKHYKPNGLLRGGVFVGIFAAWGIVSTVLCARENIIIIHYLCNVLSAILTGICLSLFAVYKIRNRNYVEPPIKPLIEEVENERQRRTSQVPDFLPEYYFPRQARQGNFP